MKKFHAVYKKDKLNLLVVSVQPQHKKAISARLKQLPYVDLVMQQTSQTVLWVVLSALTTDADLIDLEKVCRIIVGEEDAAEEENA